MHNQYEIDHGKPPPERRTDQKVALTVQVFDVPAEGAPRCRESFSSQVLELADNQRRDLGRTIHGMPIRK